MLTILSDSQQIAWVESLSSSQFHWDQKKIQDFMSSAILVGWVEQNRTQNRDQDLNTDVAAFVLLQILPTAYEIVALATHPQQQGRGCMRKLLGQIIDELKGIALNAAQHRSIFCTRVSSQNIKENPKEIWLEVHERNLKAIQLYESFGFYTVSKRAGYYQDGGAAVLMSLALS